MKLSYGFLKRAMRNNHKVSLAGERKELKPWSTYDYKRILWETPIHFWIDSNCYLVEWGWCFDLRTRRRKNERTNERTYEKASDFWEFLRSRAWSCTNANNRSRVEAWWESTEEIIEKECRVQTWIKNFPLFCCVLFPASYYSSSFIKRW